jgi:ATP-dependent Clp protease adaptor protein ClpS
VSVETIEKRSTSRQLAPNYRVLLHNDDHNSMEHVVHTLITTIPNMSETSAIEVMMEAHQNEMALVIVCNQEHAEHYCDVLKSHGLRSTIEPAE